MTLDLIASFGVTSMLSLLAYVAYLVVMDHGKASDRRRTAYPYRYTKGDMTMGYNGPKPAWLTKPRPPPAPPAKKRVGPPIIGGFTVDEFNTASAAPPHLVVDNPAILDPSVVLGFYADATSEPTTNSQSCAGCGAPRGRGGCEWCGRAG